MWLVSQLPRCLVTRPPLPPMPPFDSPPLYCPVLLIPAFSDCTALSLQGRGYSLPADLAHPADWRWGGARPLVVKPAADVTAKELSHLAQVGGVGPVYCCWCTAAGVLLIVYCRWCTAGVLWPVYCCWCTAAVVLPLLYCLYCWRDAAGVLPLVYCWWCTAVGVLLVYCCWCAVGVLLLLFCWCTAADILLV